MDKLFYVSEISKKLRCSVPTVHKLVDDGELKAVKIGERGLRITEESLEKFLDRNVVIPVEKPEAV
jgi:excisionase family DNA binding protein